jgi:single-stranded-DNA-specific exonuclease
MGNDVIKDWIIAPPWDGCAAAAREWNVRPVVAQLLFNRRVACASDAAMFLSPQLAGLHRPDELPGARAAARLLADAVRAGKRIVLYGDYDVDGVTGVAILWHALRVAGAEPQFYVPHRLEEGYGLNAAAIETLAREGAQVIVTVDCGITAVAEAELARSLGVTLIVTDHHQPGREWPVAAVVVHPLGSQEATGGDGGTKDDLLKSQDSSLKSEPQAASPKPQAYPNPDICGAGVAFKLAWAFAQEISGSERVSGEFREFLVDALVLAALGTVADVVPLVGENRIITRCGLARIPECKWVGVKALLAVSDLGDGPVDGQAVGFKLAPRLNAAGRMGHARLAIELFTRADANRAREIATYLDEQNKERQRRERSHAKEAFERVEREGLDGDSNRAIVLATEGWHAGVIGIVAARVMQRYHKPTVLIALDNGVGQGSARSIATFALHEALAACSEHLLAHGGHARAAGLRIKAECVAAFTEAFVRYAGNCLSGTACRPKLKIDATARLMELDDPTVAAILGLGPFGEGNPQPLLASEWLDLVEEPRCVGKSGEHVQLVLRDGDVTRKAIAFGAADHVPALQEHRRCRVAFEPIINEFNGRRRVELQVVDFKFPE